MMYFHLMWLVNWDVTEYHVSRYKSAEQTSATETKFVGEDSAWGLRLLWYLPWRSTTHSLGFICARLSTIPAPPFTTLRGLNCRMPDFHTCRPRTLIQNTYRLFIPDKPVLFSVLHGGRFIVGWRWWWWWWWWGNPFLLHPPIPPPPSHHQVLHTMQMDVEGSICT